MKMKTKDIIVAAIAAVLLIGAMYYIYVTLFPSNQTTATPSATVSTGTKSTTISGNIDTTTLDKLNSFKDYGGSSLDNIGRVNPFGPLN